MAPYTLEAPESEYSGYSVAVEDGHLEAYNALFTYFDPGDTARARMYHRLPELLLSELPITRVEATDIKEAGADTIQATVVFQRPDRKLFTERLQRDLTTDSIAPPTAERISRFAQTIERGRAELQQIDTAFIYMTDGPRIVQIQTASKVRENMIADSIRKAARQHLEELVSTATVRVLEFNDRSSLGLGLDGASISGVVDPRPTGWLGATPFYVEMTIECEGRREDDVTRAYGYVALQGPPAMTTDDFLCLWSGRDGREWTRVKPHEKRVRLLAVLYPDTIHGPWVSVR